ncbi:MAG: murein transglycosylase [Verrucomicrobia bacterium]|nr:MAG: murein transglycosylase [Verrucomicrobiota bacterium]
MATHRIWKGAAVLAAGGLALLGAILLSQRIDLPYIFREALAGNFYHRYDPLIAETAQQHGLDPNLVKAIIWRESRFQTDKVGSSGERGLMQVTAAAGSDWAKAMKRADFNPEELWKPEINLEVGCWYLARALAHWQNRDCPWAFALAEYNAGRSRVKRWVNSSGQGQNATATHLRTFMDFPSTRAYVWSIISRSQFYRARNEFPQQLQKPIR